MVLFDKEINDVLSLINKKNIIELNITDDLLEDAGKNNMIFADETAYELGGGNKKSLSFDLTTSSSVIDRDKIILIGNDLNEIKKDCDFIRISIIEINDDKIGGNELYERLEKIKFTKYRISPSGYMLRTTVGNKEKVRVSKDCALNASFSRIGSAYIDGYKKIPFVKKVMEIFITEETDIFEDLKEIARKRDNIADAIDHILKGMVLNDCGSCSVKDLCDEVEGMREIHKNI